MKISFILIVATVFAVNAWARLGETEAEAGNRYGSAKPVDDPITRRFDTRIPGMFQRHYVKGDIEIYALYFPSKSGKSVIGKLIYFFSSEVALNAAVELLLESNSAGQEWSSKDKKYFTRNGAKAEITSVGTYNDIRFESDEYWEYIEMIQKNDAQKIIDDTAKKAKEIKDQLKQGGF